MDFTVFYRVFGSLFIGNLKDFLIKKYLFLCLLLFFVAAGQQVALIPVDVILEAYVYVRKLMRMCGPVFICAANNTKIKRRKREI